MPIQTIGGMGISGYIELEPQYLDCLKDLEGFSHIILLYYCHLAKPYNLIVLPFMDTVSHGGFATRAPSRPNPIGLSVVRLLAREKNILKIQEIDILDGSPLLDIKFYVSDMDIRKQTRKGWLEKNIGRIDTTKDDSRFAEDRQKDR